MSTKYSPLLTVIIILFAFSISSGEINTAINIGGGYNGNLFNDSLVTEDSYSTFGGHINYYPSSSIQLLAFGQYSAYKTNNDLSNINGGGSIKIIPTSELSSISIIFSGELSHKGFGNFYSLYNQNNFATSARIIYQVASKFHIKSKVSYSAVSYINSDYGSRNGLTLSGGFNLIPFGTNSLNFNTAYYFGGYDQMPLDLDNSMGRQSNRTEEYDSYSLADITIRYSRPIGSRTGISVTLGRRYIQHDESFIVADFDVDYLSPLANLWSGPSGFVFIKHHFPKQFTLELKGGFKEKSFINAIEYSADEIETYQQSTRNDSFASFLISLSKPINIGSGNLLTPKVSVYYSSNRSTDDLYDYSNFSTSLSMNVRF
ncbi:MAG: hypothetical protein GY865_00585 [candidate division Zixibacteria bacterium]|nr:hypothetical protein [candidate division Zixibacteria bacterium]